MNSNYWENEGVTNTFTHEISQEWMKEISLETKVLDMGCGYGRITKHLQGLGFRNILGYDPSSKMISRAIKDNPGPQYTSNNGEISKQKFGLVVCFALFASCPEPEIQTEIQRIIDQQTDISSYLYISDYLTSKNPHYADKYEQRELGLYGCFGSKETVIFRHHENGHFSKLFSGWTQIKTRNISGKTLSGNHINMSQLLYKKVNQSLNTDALKLAG